jgi:nicotinate-nucleotide pyrophosphorylase (carboxylating)
MPIPALPDLMIEPIVRAALLEDLGRAGDITTQAVIPADARFAAIFAARQAGVVAGIDCARLAMTLMGANFATVLPDGSVVAPDDIIARVDGPAAAVLAGERVALNFLCHLSGVASQTAAYVAAVSGTGVRIAEIRKTMPGLRGLQKHAVKCGGGLNHRFGLDDAILIKDNHIAICGGVAAALERARAAAGHLVKIEVEVDSLEQLHEALPFAPDVVLLDNFALDDLREAVALAKGKTVLEASGGVNMTTVRAIAETGVDVISIGALTHTVPNFDIGLDAE